MKLIIHLHFSTTFTLSNVYLSSLSLYVKTVDTGILFCLFLINLYEVK